MGVHVILLGPPASGKGTHGRKLAEAAGLSYLSTGAMLREAVENQTPAGREAAPILERGGYVADELMFPILEPWLANNSTGWVLDGFPRTIGQDDFLHRWFPEHGERLDAVVALDVPKEELIERIQGRVECPDCRWTGQKSDLPDGETCPECGGKAAPRKDDKLENFLSRYDEFMKHTQPVIDRYASDERLITCDATAPKEEVAARLLEIVQNLVNHGPKA